MWLILFCSVLAGAVFLERVTYFHRISIRVGEFMRGLSNLIQDRRFAEAQMECASAPSPITRVIHAAIIRHQSSRAELKDIVQEAGQLEVPRLERRLGMLATIAFVTPLIGLLGTVVGLIESFVNVTSQSGFASATDISSGIYQSLLTTAGGLVVAIPCAVGYSYLSVARQCPHARHGTRRHRDRESDFREPPSGRSRNHRIRPAARPPPERGLAGPSSRAPPDETHAHAEVQSGVVWRDSADQCHLSGGALLHAELALRAPAGPGGDPAGLVFTLGPRVDAQIVSVTAGAGAGRSIIATSG